MDVAAQNAFLDNTIGADAGPASPASFEVALFVGDPKAGGTELLDTSEVDDGLGGITTEPNGYARVTVPNDATWAPAAEGRKFTVAPIQFPDVISDEGYGGQIATHFALFDGSVLWPSARLLEPLDVTAAGDGPTLTPTLFFADSEGA